MYFNGHDATITIKEPTNSPLEVVTLEFSESFQKAPIYGYKSVNADAFLKGEKLVQGQFSVPVNSSNKIKESLVGKTAETNGNPFIPRGSFDILITYKKESLEKKNNFYTKEEETIKITIKRAQITGFQTGTSLDGSAILEFYNFVAGEVD